MAPVKSSPLGETASEVMYGVKELPGTEAGTALPARVEIVYPAGRCTTLATRFPICTCATRAVSLKFGCAVKLIAPVPDPLAGELIVSQLAVVVAVQLKVGRDVPIVIVPSPPAPDA